MGSGGGGEQTQTSSRELPSWALGAAQGSLAQSNAAAWRDNPYPNQQISPLNAQQTQGLQMAQDRAIAGSPVMNAAQTNLTDTLNGKYLDIGTNPAWNPMAQRITDAYSTGTAAQTDAAAARANAFGGTAYGEQLGYNQRGLGDSLAAAAGDLYNQERGRQMQANLFAPQAAQADYQDAQALLGVGDTYRQYNQDLLNNNYQNAYQAADWPYKRAEWFNNQIAGLTGGSGTQSSTGPNPYQPNKTAGALGGAMSGAAAGAMIGAPIGGVGAVPGALVGGLLGAAGGYFM